MELKIVIDVAWKMYNAYIHVNRFLQAVGGVNI